LAGVMPRDSDASATAAVLAMERLRRLERDTTTWVGGIPKNYATFCVSVEALPTFTRPLDNPLRNLNNGLLNQEGKLSNPFPTKPLPLLPLPPGAHLAEALLQVELSGVSRCSLHRGDIWTHRQLPQQETGHPLHPPSSSRWAQRLDMERPL
jgi:hypothetical protein